MAGVSSSAVRLPAGRLYATQALIFVGCALIGSGIASALRLLVLEPGPDTTVELWTSLTLGQSVFLLVLGLPLALLGLAIIRRMSVRARARRLTVLAVELGAGVVYFAFILGGSVGYLGLGSAAVGLLPWVLFGLIARAD